MMGSASFPFPRLLLRFDEEGVVTGTDFLAEAQHGVPVDATGGAKDDALIADDGGASILLDLSFMLRAASVSFSNSHSSGLVHPTSLRSASESLAALQGEKWGICTRSPSSDKEPTSEDSEDGERFLEETHAEACTDGDRTAWISAASETLEPYSSKRTRVTSFWTRGAPIWRAWTEEKARLRTGIAKASQTACGAA